MKEKLRNHCSGAVDLNLIISSATEVLNSFFQLLFNFSSSLHLFCSLKQIVCFLGLSGIMEWLVLSEVIQSYHLGS